MRKNDRKTVATGMRIVYMSDVDISEPNGPGVNEREFTRTLQIESKKRGDRVFLLIPRPSRRVDFALRHAEFYDSRVLKSNPFLGLRILLVTWHLCKLAVKTLKQSKVDLFVIRLSPNCMFVPVILSFLEQRYVIKTLGNIYQFDERRSNSLQHLYLLFSRKVLGKVLRDAVFIDVCTPQYYDGYTRKYALNNIRIIENSVNTERFYPMDRILCKKKCNLERFGTIVGYCGGYPSRRGAAELVQISQKLTSRYDDCGILIIGDDDGLRRLKEKARSLGTDGYVIFKGIVDYSEMPYYVNCMDVGIALDTDERIDSVGNSSQKIRQYLACGVPIICPDRTNELIVRHGFGTGVNGKNLDEIFEKIRFWLDRRPEEAIEFRIKAHQFAKRSFSTRVTYRERRDSWIKAVGDVR